jgi:hypothetical protein
VDLSSSSSDDEDEEVEEEEENLTYDQVPYFDSVVQAGLLKVPKNVSDYLLNGPEHTLENRLLTTALLPSSDEFVAVMAANPGKSLIAAAGQSHLQENHTLALLQADLLQVKIDQWSTTLSKEQAKVKSKERIVQTFEYELAQEEEKLELAHRKVDLTKEFGKKHPPELAAKRSTCQDAIQQVQQNTHLKNIATLLAMVSQGLFQGQSEEALKRTLPFAQLQDPGELATKSNLDSEKVKDLTCRQYIGIVRHIFLFGYHFSMAYTQVGPADGQPIVLSTKATKKKCRRVVCDMLNIAHYSSSTSANTTVAKAKRKRRRSSTSKVRVETMDTAVELLSIFSKEEINLAKATPGSLSDNLHSIHLRKKSADRQVQSQDDSSGGPSPPASRGLRLRRRLLRNRCHEQRSIRRHFPFRYMLRNRCMYLLVCACNVLSAFSLNLKGN